MSVALANTSSDGDTVNRWALVALAVTAGILAISGIIALIALVLTSGFNPEHVSAVLSGGLSGFSRQ